MEKEKIEEFKNKIGNVSKDLQDCIEEKGEIAKEHDLVRNQAAKDKQNLAPKIAQLEERVVDISNERDFVIKELEGEKEQGRIYRNAIDNLNKEVNNLREDNIKFSNRLADR